MNTNLNYLFIDLVPNYAFILDVKPITKEQFAEKVKSTYSLNEPKNALFYQSILKSVFNTIRLSDNRDNVLLD